MSSEERSNSSWKILTLLKRSKVRLAFTKQERESREEKTRYLERLPAMSDEVFSAEIDAITEQLAKINEEIMGLPFHKELSKENERKAEIIEAKYTCLIQERNRRAEKPWTQSTPKSTNIDRQTTSHQHDDDVSTTSAAQAFEWDCANNLRQRQTTTTSTAVGQLQT